MCKHLARNLTQERLHRGEVLWLLAVSPSSLMGPEGQLSSVCPSAAQGWGTEQPVGFCEGDTTASLTSEASISRCDTCSPRPGTLTVGFITVRGLNAYQDVLVQQVLGVRDDGLQLQREGHRISLDRWGTGG